MSAPYEIIAAPFTLWTAAVGTAFPDLAAAPSVSWTKVGSSGDLNYEEEGVTVQHQETVEKWRPLGAVGARKAFRTAEGLLIGLTLADLTLEQYKLALNGNSVTTTAAGSGTAGTKKIGLSRGLAVTRYALLIRGDVSPYGDNWSMQYEVPIAIQNGEPELVFRKNTPAGLKLTFEALEDTGASSVDERFGRLVVQNDDAN